jgi:hypothetical protein
MNMAKIAALLLAFWAVVGLVEQSTTAHRPPAQQHHD